MTADDALLAATRAGLPQAVAARLVLDTDPSRYAKAIESAGALMVLCKLAGRPEQIGDMLGKTIDEARLDLNRQMVEETNATVIDKVPAPASMWSA